MKYMIHSTLARADEREDIVKELEAAGHTLLQTHKTMHADALRDGKPIPSDKDKARAEMADLRAAHLLILLTPMSDHRLVLLGAAAALNVSTVVIGAYGHCHGYLWQHPVSQFYGSWDEYRKSPFGKLDDTQ